MNGTDREFRLASGDRASVGEVVGAGATGIVYRARKQSSGEEGAIKVYHNECAGAAAERRIALLAALDLPDRCPTLVLPKDPIEANGVTGYFTDYADGEGLVERLESGRPSFLTNLVAAVELVHAVDMMHQQGVGHGDVAAENIRTVQNGDVIELSLIDPDNFFPLSHATGGKIPPPSLAGHPLNLAPEQARAHREGRQAPPTEGSECFALAVVVSELLLLRHPAKGRDATPEEYARAMEGGFWPDDPAVTTFEPVHGGRPPAVLNPRLKRLFRRAFSLDPDERPRPAEWKEALLHALDHVFMCPDSRCGGGVIVDASKNCCPYCGTPYPRLALRLPSDVRIPITRNGVTIGRDDLGGVATVSRRHLELRRVGPDTRARPVGRNPTWRRTPKGWVELEAEREVLVKQGDRLRLAEVEVELVGEGDVMRRSA